MKAKQQQKTWILTLTTLEAGICRFEYDSQALAHEQYLMYQTVGIIGGYVIKRLDLA